MCLDLNYSKAYCKTKSVPRDTVLVVKIAGMTKQIHGKQFLACSAAGVFFSKFHEKAWNLEP